MQRLRQAAPPGTAGRLGIPFGRAEAPGRDGDPAGNAAVERVVQLWREALASPLHSPFCTCVAFGGVLVLGNAALEEDLLDFLEPRYAGEPALLAPLRARRADRQDDFADWLRRSSDALPPALRARLIEDLSTVLGSIAEASRPGRFQCI